MRLLTSNTYNILFAVLVIITGLVGAHFCERPTLQKWMRALGIIGAILLVFAGAFWLGLVVAYNGFDAIVN